MKRCWLKQVYYDTFYILRWSVVLFVFPLLLLLLLLLFLFLFPHPFFSFFFLWEKTNNLTIISSNVRVVRFWSCSCRALTVLRWPFFLYFFLFICFFPLPEYDAIKRWKEVEEMWRRNGVQCQRLLIMVNGAFHSVAIRWVTSKFLSFRSIISLTESIFSNSVSVISLLSYVFWSLWSLRRIRAMISFVSDYHKLFSRWWLRGEEEEGGIRHRDVFTKWKAEIKWRAHDRVLHVLHFDFQGNHFVEILVSHQACDSL